jgi:hypothetical protein
VRVRQCLERLEKLDEEWTKAKRQLEELDDGICTLVKLASKNRGQEHVYRFMSNINISLL